MSWEIASVLVNSAVVIFTACMARATYKLGKETKRADDKFRKKEAEQAFQSLFMFLRKDIKTYDDLYIRYQGGDLSIRDISDVEAIKTSLSRLTEVVPCSFSKIDSLLEKVLLDDKLLRQIWTIESLINDSIRHIKQFHQMIDGDSNKNKTTTQDIPIRITNIRFRLRQFACYFICEAERLGHKELADVMKKISEFEPDETMQRLFQELDISPETDSCYAHCSTKSLVEKAVERTRKKGERNQKGDHNNG